MNEKDLDKLMDDAIHIPIPEGLGERLEQQIDELAALEKKRSLRRFIVRAASAAAVVLLCVALFLKTDPLSHRSPQLADTYTDPKEAAAAAEQALAFMSTQLNKGMDQVADAGQEIEKVNQILKKHFKE